MNEKGEKFSTKIYGEILIQAAENILEKYNKIAERDVKEIIGEYFEEIKKRKDTEGRNFIKQVCNLEFSNIRNFSLIKDEFGKEDICILLDEGKRLIEEFIELKKKFAKASYQQQFKILPEIKNIRRKIEQFIVSPFLGENNRILTPLYNDNLSLYILNPSESNLYQKEIGFCIDIEEVSIL